MGTTDNEKAAMEKLQLLINLIERMGWSRRQFAEEYYWSMYSEGGTEEECDREVERIKKSMTRRSIKEERLDAYLNFIYRQKDFKNLEIIVPRYIPLLDFDDSVIKDEMRAISRSITNELNRREQDHEE